METILIKDKWTIDKTLTTNEYLSYLGLSMLLRRNVISYFASTDILAYLLSNSYPANSRLTSAISNGIIGLAEKIMIILSQSAKTNEWILDLQIMIDDNKKKDTTHDKLYTIVDETSIHKILQSNTEYYTKSISLVRFYIYVLSTIFKVNNGYKGVGFTSIENMSDTTGYNTKTVSLYLKQLEELELIYIYRAKDRIKFDTGEIVEITHTYGRYKDKDLIVKIGKTHEEEYGSKGKHKRINKYKGDKTRGLSQKYVHLDKCLAEGKKNPYEYEVNRDIYFAMVELNKKYDEEGRKRGKDLSMFREFDFYIQ